MKIAIVTPGRNFSPNYVRSIVDTTNWCALNEIELIYSNYPAANIYTARINALGRGSEKKPPEILDGEDYDYVFFIDSDMGWRPEDIAMMIEMDEDVVSGVYVCGTDGKLSVLMDNPEKPGDIQFHTPNSIPNEVFKIHYAAMGFLMVRKGVLETLPYPWFDFRMHPDSGVFMSEDLAFTMSIREAGFDIWCNPDVKITHEKFWELTVG